MKNLSKKADLVSGFLEILTIVLAWCWFGWKGAVLVTLLHFTAVYESMFVWFNLTDMAHKTNSEETSN